MSLLCSPGHYDVITDQAHLGTQILPMIQFKNLPKNPNPGFLGSDDDKDPFYYMQLSGKYTTAFHQTWGQQPLAH